MLYSINILNITACREKHKKRRKSPQIEGTFGHLLKNIRPSKGGKSAGGELRYHHIVLTAGAVANQQLAVLPPGHHDSHMGIVRIEGQVSRLGLCLRNGRTVGVLGSSPAAPAQDVFAAGDVVKYPVHHAGAVQAIGPVGTSSGISSRPYLGKLAPAGVPAEHQGFYSDR